MFSIATNLISALASLLWKKDSNNLAEPETKEEYSLDSQDLPSKDKQQDKLKKQGQKNSRETLNQHEDEPENKKKKHNDTQEQLPAFPKSFYFCFPKFHKEIVTYHDETKYANKGKTIKRGMLLNSTPIYVKYNPKSGLEGSISTQLMFATLYLCTTDKYHCISLVGSPLSDFIGFGTQIENITDFTFDIIAQLFFLEKAFHIHNDIKPENIVLYDGHWFLIDYEICHEFNLNEVTYSKSYSWGYRSPERKEDFIISPKSDIYSLGLVIIEILKDKRVRSFESKDESEIFEKCDKFKDLHLYDSLKKMLRSDVNERSSPGELVQSLLSTEPKLKETLLYFQNMERFYHLLNYEPPVAKSFDLNILLTK